MLTRLLAIATGFILGTLLFSGYPGVLSWGYGQLFLALLALGLGWLFPRNWLSAALSTVMMLPLLLIPLLGLALFVSYIGGFLHWTLGKLRAPVGMYVLTVTIILLSSWIGSRISSWIAGRLSWPRTARFLGLIPIVAALGTAFTIVAIGDTPEGDRERQSRALVKEVSNQMQRAYQAEMAYSAGQPDKAFTCDGRQLSKIPGLEWTYRPYLFFSQYGVSQYVIESYMIELRCPLESRPHRFCLTTFPWDPNHPGSIFWMDEKGKLVEVDAAKADPQTVCPIP